MKTPKPFFAIVIVLIFSQCHFSEDQDSNQNSKDLKNYEQLFSDLKFYLSEDKANIWKHPLYGPLMLVNREDRSIIANMPDKSGHLTAHGSVFTGYLNDDINMANTSFIWNNQRWTMVLLPLPEEKSDQLNLLIHELFHRIQEDIGFENLHQPKCEHLDKKEGRIYLKLEYEALKKALDARSEDECLQHIKNALYFRLYRYHLFPNGKNDENELELLEGLAEYTGSILSGRSEKELKKHYQDAIDQFYKNETFVRSFAYYGFPVYGYFMQQKQKNWNLNIHQDTQLTDYILDFYHIEIPSNIEQKVNDIKTEYRYNDILQVENAREQKQKEILAKMDVMFKENPVLIIPFQNMNIGFNPGNIIPYREMGTFYPNARITDDWGILEIEKGAIITPNWSAVIVSKPNQNSQKSITGNGWTLEINEKWEMIQIGNNYQLKKKEAI